MKIPVWTGGRWAGEIVAYTDVDAEDFDRLNQYRWFLTCEGYVARCTPRPEKKTILMAREILGLAPGDRGQADHKDRDRLNNTRENLRVLTGRQNSQNRSVPARSNGKPPSSNYRGVSASQNGKRWRAAVNRRYLGTFDTEKEAAEVARRYRQEHLPYATD